MFIMKLTRLQVGLTAALGIAGVTGYGLQAEAGANRRAERERLQREQTAVTRLQEATLRLKRQWSETEELRAAAAGAEALRVEVADLNAQAASLRTVPPPPLRRAPEPVALQGEVFDVSRLDEKPAPLAQPRPIDPGELRGGGANGEVVVDFVVMADGTVRNAIAVRASEPRLEAPAVDAVSQWKFKPGRKGGRAVQTHLQVPIVFAVGQNDDPARASAGQARPDPSAPWF